MQAVLPPANDRYHEDYQVGAALEAGPVDFSESDIIAFAKQFDPQAMHTDPVAAEAGEFDGLIASGWHTVCAVMRLYVDHYLTTVASLASPGVDEIRWRRPVRPGERLWMRSTVRSTRISKSRPHVGIVEAHVEAFDQLGEVFMTMNVTSFIRLRNVNT